ncbi:MAG: two-component sensor histidine kinase, partial [Gemmatimonadota bacterium]
MAHETERTFPIGLRGLVLLAVLGPVGVVGGGVLWAGGQVVERVVQERLEEDVQLVARAIQLPLSRSLAEGRAEQL